MDRKLDSGRVGGKRSRPDFHMPWSPVTADYRVVAADYHGELRLIRLAFTRHAAKEVAEAAAETVPEDVVSVFTQQWVGNLAGGDWEEVPPRKGGYRRTFHRRLRQFARRERLQLETMRQGA